MKFARNLRLLPIFLLIDITFADDLFDQIKPTQLAWSDFGNNNCTTPGPLPPDCGALPEVINGYLLRDYGYHVGHIRFVRCFDGFTLDGSSATICRWSGWSKPGRCVKVVPQECSLEPNIENGIVKSGPNAIGERREFDCLQGYQLNGFSALICDAFGRWVAMGGCDEPSEKPPRATSPPRTSTATTAGPSRQITTTERGYDYYQEQN